MHPLDVNHGKLPLLRAWKRLSMAVVALSTCVAAHAQAAYPARPLQMIIPFPAGGPTDSLGRSFAQVMDTKLSQRVVVINRDGGSTTVGMNALLAAPADGYTVLYGPVTALTVHLHWMKGLQFKADSFLPICQTFENMFILAARPDSRFTRFSQVVEEGKREAGRLSYGHPGISSSPHLAGAELFQGAEVQARDVAFRGEPGMLPTLLNGDIDLVVATTSFVNTHRLRPLAAFSEKRLAQFPHTPTVKELGYTVSPSGYGGLFVRADTPAEVVTRLEQACRDTMADPVFREAAQRLYQQTDFLDHTAFKARIQTDHRSKGELLKTVKLER